MARAYTLAELAELVSGEVAGDPGMTVSGFNALDLAGPDELSFVTSDRMADQLAASRAGACIVPRSLAGEDRPLIIVDDPDLASAVIHCHMVREPFTATGIHPSAVIGSNCTLPEEISIGPLASIGDQVHIGKRVTLHPGVRIGDRVRIGDDCVLHANAVVAHDCTLGNRVILHHGAVIGSDGFGFATDRSTGAHVDKPQVGTVLLEDDVQIGANSCVDRAAFGVTRIRSGVRIDNLVMVGHNVDVGENSILVSQTGIAGSTVLGRNVVLGARSGIADHLHLGNGVMVAAMGGVHSDLPDGAVVGGVPAIDIKSWGKSAAAYRRLPEMLKQLRALRKKVDRLSALADRPDK